MYSETLLPSTLLCPPSLSTIILLIPVIEERRGSSAMVRGKWTSRLRVQSTTVLFALSPSPSCCFPEFRCLLCTNYRWKATSLLVWIQCLLPNSCWIVVATGLYWEVRPSQVSRSWELCLGSGWASVIWEESTSVEKMPPYKWLSCR